MLLSYGIIPPLPCAPKQYLFSLKEQWFHFVDRLANLQHVVVPKRQSKEYQVSFDYEFTKKILYELNWPPCGQRPRIGSDVETSEERSDVEMADVIDPLGKEAIDATKLLPNLAGKESSATGMSVAMKQLPTDQPADETNVDDDDSVHPVPVKEWPRDIPKAPKSEENRHLYFAFDPEKNDPSDEHVAERKLESSSSFVSHWRQPEHE